MIRAVITPVASRASAVSFLCLVFLWCFARPAAGWRNDWNCNLQCYWGSLGGSPSDSGDYFGVMPGATDGYDLIDSKKPGEPIAPYLYAWFERPAWGEGRIMADWRAAVPEGTTKQWGDHSITDTWNVKTNLDNGPSGYYDPTCDIFNELEYPIAADIYITWAFGVAEEPPYPAPPDDYIFEIRYRGGISPKPAGTGGSVPPPAMNTMWDMEATPHIVVPLWNECFQPWSADCITFMPPDTARFLFIVTNPVTCAIVVQPDEPTPAPATFTFTATGTGTEPHTFSWDFGDGGIITGNPVLHTYDSKGMYTVACMVTDANGVSGMCAITVTVNWPPTCDITYAPAPPFTDDLITFDAGAVDPDGQVVSVDWDFGDGLSAIGQTVIHAYASERTYVCCATVTDDLGFSTTCCGDVTVLVARRLLLPAQSWYIVTVPWVCVDPSPGVIFDELLPPLCPLDMLSGCLHRYDHERQRYETYYHWAPTPFGAITPGDGYWLWAYDDTTICYRATPPGEPVAVHFPTSGWYLFGSPRALDVPIETCVVSHALAPPVPFADAANVWIMDPLLFYDPGSGYYASCGVRPIDLDHHLRAFRGYWLYTFVEDVTLEIPPP